MLLSSLLYNEITAIVRHISRLYMYICVVWYGIVWYVEMFVLHGNRKIKLIRERIFALQILSWN